MRCQKGWEGGGGSAYADFSKFFDGLEDCYFMGGVCNFRCDGG